MITLVLLTPLAPPFGRPTASRHVIIERSLPATVQYSSDAVYFRVPVLYQDGRPINLTLASAVTATYRSPDGTKTEAAGEVENAATGLVRFPTPVGYLPTAGRWLVQVRVDWPDGGVLYTPPQKIKVKPNL